MSTIHSKPYRNWVRGALGLLHLQEGLYPFTDHVVKAEHTRLLQNLTPCTSCTVRNILPAHATGKVCIHRDKTKCNCRRNKNTSCNTCSKLYDEIITRHRFKDPAWVTDASTWCTDHWQIAKCFMTTTTLGSNNTAAETDAAGLLSIIINGSFFQPEIQCNINPPNNTFCQARGIRNEILHNSTLELSDTEVKKYLQGMIDVLEDQKHLINEPSAQAAVKKLKQMIKDKLVITTNQEAKAIQNALDAIKEAKEKAEESITKLTEEKQNTLKDQVSEGKQEIKDASKEVLSEIKSTASSAFEKEYEPEKKRLKLVHDDHENRIKALEKQQRDIEEKVQTYGNEISLLKVTERKYQAQMDYLKQKQEDDESETKAALDKAWGKLIDYMNPDPILKCATEYDLFGYRQTREISEEKTTIDQNRKILQKVKARGKTGYEKLKECLKKTDQSKLVELLESIERGEDISNLLQQIQEERMLKELRDKLIKFYRNQHATILLSPLVEEEDKPPLLAFYVMPELNAVKIERALGGGKEEKTQVGSLRDVFYKDNKLCSEIYLIADAGLGKTALSKRLALTWCHAKKPVTGERKYFSQEATDTMAGFDLVFLLLLRDSSKECDIDEMIFNQIVDRFADTPCTLKDLGKILSKETCLVILDGLDEWIHPPNSCKLGSSAIPHRKEWKCTILTTTRPWKYSVSGIRASRIDKKIEIAGLSEDSANELKKSVISHLCNEKDENILEKHVNDFDIAVQAKGISDLEAVPLLLMYLLCLWCDDLELGNTACELYSNIIELLLSRTVKQCKGVDLPLIPEYTQGDIPQCFSENESCRGFYTLLTSLGQLAFHTLFKETREENTLVFNRTVAKQYLNEQCLTFCFKTGILSQSKDLRKVLKQESKVSFAHKTVQEYFAALYMRSTLDQTSVPEIVLSKCKCVKDILEMSKILIFLSGFSANVLSLISREMMKIINEDEIALKYRSSIDWKSDALNQFQDMCVSCCKELPDDNQVSLCLQDVFIDESCRQEQYREHLKQMTTRNKQNIISLYIYMDDMSYTPYRSAREVIEYFGLNDLENIEKICYDGKYNDGDILPLLNSSVQSLFLSCRDSSLSRLLYEKLYSLQQLEAIYIRWFEMSHEQLTLLWDYISQRRCMRHIELVVLRCTDHGKSCTGGSVDLSQHSDLRTLRLGEIPVSQLYINMSAIEMCSLVDLSDPDLVLRFVNCDPADSKVKSFACGRLESPVAVEALVQTLPQLWQVKDVRWFNINLGSRRVSLSPQMINIEIVELTNVAMSAGAARGLANSALTLPQPVVVYMKCCTITPREEFETWRAEIRSSSCFRLEDDMEEDSEYDSEDDSEEDSEYDSEDDSEYDSKEDINKYTLMFVTIKDRE